MALEGEFPRWSRTSWNLAATRCGISDVLSYKCKSNVEERSVGDDTWDFPLASHQKPLLHWHCVIQLSPFFFRQKGSFWPRWCTARPVSFTAKSSKNPLLVDKLHTMNRYESDLRMLFLVNLDVSEKVNTSWIDMILICIDKQLSITLEVVSIQLFLLVFKTIFENLEFHQNSLSFQFGAPPNQKEYCPSSMSGPPVAQAGEVGWSHVDMLWVAPLCNSSVHDSSVVF